MALRKLRSIIVKVFFVFLVIICVTSCVKDEYDFDKFSGKVELNPSIAAPLVKGRFTLKNLFSSNVEDSTLVFRGDSIVFYYKKDSLFSYSVEDFGAIPVQRTLAYYVRTENDIPAALMPDELAIPDADTFEFSFDNGMKLDSLVLESGFLNIDIESTFEHNGYIRISIPGLVSANKVPFSRVMQFSSATGTYTASQSYPIDGYTMEFGENDTTNIIHLQFDVLLYRNDGRGIQSSDFVKVDFTFEDIDKYQGIYGYMGHNEQVIDTIIDFPFEDFGGLSGTLAVTNPRLNFNYTNSLGIPFGMEMEMTGIFNNGPAVKLKPDNLEINSPQTVDDPEVEGEISLSRTNIPNIDSFLVFPPPNQLDLYLSATSNPEGDLGQTDFILQSSGMNIDMELEIPLEFRADLQLVDTFDIDNESLDQVTEIEYINLYYSVLNEFPLNFDIKLVLYDSITATKYDTIRMGASDQRGLLVAADVDENGISILDNVRPNQGVASLNKQQITNLLENTNKIIVIMTVSSTADARSVKLMSNYALEFKFALDASVVIETDL